ncbi:MAG TPA: cytochrome c [candidate division Zixibacteria bacterium]|nr:cytochrome c [candidate division Zixibacteria bacterium]
MSSGYKAGLFVGLSVLALGCSRQKSKPMLEYMPNMAHSPAVKAQERPMFLPVAGTVPRDWEAYPYGVGDTLKAAAELSNPMPMTMDVLEAGRKSFNTFCIVCHGAKGDGKGYIIPKFPQPPSLLTDRVANWPDGRIFHVISRGQQTMPNYASQLDPAQRWAVVNYVRVLQRSARPTAADLELMKKLGIDFSEDEPDTSAPKLWPER